MAAAAVGGAVRCVDLASVGKRAIAISSIARARGHAASAAGTVNASDVVGAYRRGAIGAAAAACGSGVGEIGLAAVVGIVVAIGITRTAPGDLARPCVANDGGNVICRVVHQCGAALTSASDAPPAMENVRVDVCFAAVRVRIVAVFPVVSGGIDTASDSAIECPAPLVLACRCGVGDIAGVATRAAVLGRV